MITRKLSLTTIAIGAVAFIAGIYSVTGSDFSLLLAGLGLLALLCGTAFLLLASRPWIVSSPHPRVIGITVVAAALHAYEFVYPNVGGPSVGFLLWAMVPYGLCLTLSAFLETRGPAITGGALALALDAWGYYSVFVNPGSSTAAVGLLFIPLWSTIIVVPLATFAVWCMARRRRGL